MLMQIDDYIDVDNDCDAHLKFRVILPFFILFPRTTTVVSVELACTLFEKRTILSKRAVLFKNFSKISSPEVNCIASSASLVYTKLVSPLLSSIVSIISSLENLQLCCFSVWNNII